MSDGELAFTSFDRALRRKVINRGQLMVEGGSLIPTQNKAKPSSTPTEEACP